MPHTPIESLADDLLVFLTKINALPCVLGGLSMGGYVCFACWRRFAAEIRGLLLINTRSDADSPGAKEGRQRMARQALEEGIDPIADAMVPRLLSKANHRPELTARARSIVKDCPPATVAHASVAMHDRADSTPLLASIRVPTLIITGEDDPIIPAEIPRQMHEAIAGSKLTSIPGAAHLTPMEQPHQVNRAIRAFLRTIR